MTHDSAAAPAASPVRPERLAYAAVASWVGLSVRTLRRMVTRGDFPAPVAIAGLRGPRFRRGAVEVWLASQ